MLTIHVPRSGAPTQRRTASGGELGGAAAVPLLLLPPPEERLKLLSLDDSVGGGGALSSCDDWGIGGAERSTGHRSTAGLRLGLPPEEARDCTAGLSNQPNMHSADAQALNMVDHALGQHQAPTQSASSNTTRCITPMLVVASCRTCV